jgi:hypothetical protein
MAMDYAKRYLQYFDDIYQRESVTRILETDPLQYEFKGANQVLVNKITISGNSDYSKSTGYAAGSVANEFDAYTLSMDRGLKIPLDAVDSDEALVTAMKIQDSYLREKFFPELDLYRFTKVYTDIAASSVAGTNIVSGTPTEDTILNDIDAGIELLDDAEVPKSGRVIFISENSYRKLKNSGEFYKTRIATEMSKILNREIDALDGHFLIRVPSSRFYTAATFGAGSNTLTGTAINFMITHIPAIMAIIKRNVLRIFTPEQNLDSDGYLMTARQYHGANVYENKVAGVYINKRAA